MWRYPIIFARLCTENVNIFLRNVGTRMVRKTAESVLRNLDLMGQMQDLFSSVEFERQHLSTVPMFKTRQELFKFALDGVTVADGLYAEFGVYKGDSINRLARLRPHQIFHGFDSFEGLPESWTLGARTGAFSVGGRLPAVHNNVVLVKGHFEQTLSEFISRCDKKAVAFLHVDCDLYSATKIVLDRLAPPPVEGNAPALRARPAPGRRNRHRVRRVFQLSRLAAGRVQGIRRVHRFSRPPGLRLHRLHPQRRPSCRAAQAPRRRRG